MRIVSTSPPLLRIEGHMAGGMTRWSFRTSYAGVNGLGGRVSNFSLRDEGGNGIPLRIVAPGLYEAARAATRFSYDVKPEAPAFLTGSAHVSWITGDRGLLMTGDLLPVAMGDVRLRLSLPAGWGLSTTERGGGGGEFVVREVGQAVFVCGRDLRHSRGRAAGFDYTVTTAGEWAFSDEEAAAAVAEILKTNRALVGPLPRALVLVAILPPPVPSAATHWAAETRGGTVTLLSGRMPSNISALAQLNGALMHELLHLWVPNGLALSGDYAWFYEGFTNYVAVLAGLRRGQLFFHDYLGALGRAYDGYRSARGKAEAPLVAPQHDRWGGDPTVVYQKGMLVAFLYDLSLSLDSKGRLSLVDVYRELFRRHSEAATQAEGSRAVVAALKEVSGMGAFVDKYIIGPAEIDLSTDLARFGLKVEPGGVRTHLSVVDAPTRAQQELLKKFGYNKRLEAAPRPPRRGARERQ